MAQDNEKDIFEIRKIKNNLWYFLVGIVSIIALVFGPMFGSEVNMKLNLPNTIAGWVVYVVTKVVIATLNLIIFHCFVKQAKVNVRDNENFKAANEILRKQKESKKQIPKSPKQHFTAVYGKKGAFIFLSSILGAVCLSQAVLTYDYIALVTYVFTLLLGIICGFIQMKSEEEWWTDGYYEYALWKKEQEEAERKTQGDLALAQENSNKQGNSCVPNNSGTNLLESSNNKLYTWDNSKSVVVDCCNSSDCVLGGALYPSDATTDSTDIRVESPVEENKNTTTDPCVS